MPKQRYVITATCFDRKGRVVSTGTNDWVKSHPLQLHFAVLAGMPEKRYLHAEVLALIRSGKQKVHSIVVTRYGADGQPRLAKPCKICQIALRAYGVEEVHYTTNEGIVSVNIKYLK